MNDSTKWNNLKHSKLDIPAHLSFLLEMVKTYLVTPSSTLPLHFARFYVYHAAFGQFYVFVGKTW